MIDFCVICTSRNVHAVIWVLVGTLSLTGSVLVLSWDQEVPQTASSPCVVLMTIFGAEYSTACADDNAVVSHSDAEVPGRLQQLPPQDPSTPTTRKSIAASNAPVVAQQRTEEMCDSGLVRVRVGGYGFTMT
jgi:hypothetical protein